MDNSKFKKNQIIKSTSGESDTVYRVLEIAENVLVIDCEKRTMPMWKTIEQLKEYVDIVEEPIDIELTPKQEKIAYERYNMISDVLPFIANELIRTQIIKEMAKKYTISEQSIRKYLCIYLATLSIKALAPNSERTKKELSYDEKNIRKALNKWYYTTKKRTLKNCYILMLKNYYCDEYGKLKDKYPSYYQFRYFYRKYNKPSTEMISRNTLSYYQRNQRALIGDGVQGFAKTVGMGMLDSTTCDIYLINESNEIVGRPILTFCVDAYTGMICGYSLSWEGGVYSLRDLMLNVISDKVTHCKGLSGFRIAGGYAL